MNLLDQIPLVTRRVRADGIELTRPYTASARELWEAVTDPSRLEHWFEPVTLGDGRFRLDSGTGGRIRVCTPEEHLSLDWDDGTLDLRFSPGSLTLTLTAAHDSVYGPAVDGVRWDSALVALALHLAMDTEDIEGEEETFLRRVTEEWAGVDTPQTQRTIEFYLE